MANFKNRLDTPKSHKLICELGVENEMAAILLETQVLYDMKNGTLSDNEIFNRYTALIERLNSVVLMVADPVLISS